MKILQITNSLKTGGAEKLLLDSIPLFNKTPSVRMDLLLIDGGETPFLNQLKNTSDCIISSLNNNVYNPWSIIKIIPYLRKYDIIHIHLFPSLYWVVLAKIISFSKVKLVYTEHSTSNRRRKKMFFKFCDKIIYSFLKKIITISPEVGSNLGAHLGFRTDKFTLIENGINLAKIKEEKKVDKKDILFNTNENSQFLIQVSSFRYPKDQKTVIRSLKLLPNNIILLLVGDGPLRKECEDLVKELELSDRVCFLGIRIDAVNLLKTSDIVILSSHYEGLSLSCLEGMASGKPFIASDAPGLKEIVENAGILFPIEDEKTLARKIEELLSDIDYNNKIVESCMERTLKYDINVSINKQIKLYKSIL